MDWSAASWGATEQAGARNSDPWPPGALTSTNVALPLSNWTSIATNQFGAGGVFSFTNGIQASWLEVDKENFAGTFKGMPVRDEMNEPSVREQYVVEYYSR